MSHYARVSVNVFDNVNPKLLKKAVKLMDERYGIKTIDKDATFYNKTTKQEEIGVTAALTVNGTPTPIQFLVKNTRDGKHTLSVIGESYRTGYNSIEEFVSQFKQQYSVATVLNTAEANNYKTVSRTEKEDGTIVLRYQVAA